MIIDKKASLTVNPGSIIAGFILPNGGGSLTLTGTMNSSTAAEQAMKKAVANKIPVLLPNGS